jgi:uncharacterized protein YceK
MKIRWLLALVVILPLALSGCASVVTNYSGAPGNHAGAPGGNADSGLQAFWLADGTQIAITISGSSSCPYIATGIHVIKTSSEGNAISVDVPALPNGPCTQDYVPHTTVFITPGTITTTVPLAIEVMGTSIVLPVK